jgi:hypothetical protein
MTLMYTYETIATVGGDRLPSNRWGTEETIYGKFGTANVRINRDVAPVDVEPKDFCPNWPGFARVGFDPRSAG